MELAQGMEWWCGVGGEREDRDKQLQVDKYAGGADKAEVVLGRGGVVTTVARREV